MFSVVINTLDGSCLDYGKNENQTNSRKSLLLFQPIDLDRPLNNFLV